MGDIERLVASLRDFERTDVLIKEVRKELREPVPIVRKRIKAEALEMLPSGGGFAAWVASSRITATVKLSGKKAGVTLKGGRNSLHKRSDLKAIDRGRLRHPSWGRRFRGQWHTQIVEAGFFTRPATEAPEWAAAVERATERALKAIHA